MKNQDRNRENGMNELEAALRNLERPAAAGDLAERLMAAIPEGAGAGDLPRIGRRWYRAAGWAAALMMGLGGVIYYVMTAEIDESVMIDSQAALIQEIEAETMSARLLASANILAEQPAGIAFAEDTYRYLTESYPDTTAGQEAKKLLEKNDKEMH